MNKYILLTFVALGVPSLFVGCAGITTKTSRTQDEYLASIDQKMQELEKKVSNLNTASLNLGNRVEELSQTTSDTVTHCSKMQDTLGGLSSRIELKDSAFETVLAETQKGISDLEKKMTEIEKAKNDLQNQLLSLQIQKSRIGASKIDQHTEAMKEEAKETIEQGREMMRDATSGKKSDEDKKIEAIAATQERETLQKLLDEALTLYRDGHYKEAIGKWDEVIVIDPSNLEAKFNIEITKEKIKSLLEK